MCLTIMWVMRGSFVVFIGAAPIPLQHKVGI